MTLLSHRQEEDAALTTVSISASRFTSASPGFYLGPGEVLRDSQGPSTRGCRVMGIRQWREISENNTVLCPQFSRPLPVGL